MHLDSVDQKTSRGFVADDMSQKLGGDAWFTSKLIPQYALGCRRMTPGSEYLQSLRKPNVGVVFQSVSELTPTGIIDSAGNHEEVDIIIFATGFDTNFTPSYKVLGQGGRNLREEWKSFPEAYLSIMAEGFPNMFRTWTSLDWL
jgi:cation diffusion facilitator CzcD-associated flavoprotein CzcO